MLPNSVLNKQMRLWTETICAEFCGILWLFSEFNQPCHHLTCSAMTWVIYWVHVKVHTELFWTMANLCTDLYNPRTTTFELQFPTSPNQYGHWLCWLGDSGYCDTKSNISKLPTTTSTSQYSYGNGVTVSCQRLHCVAPKSVSAYQAMTTSFLPLFTLSEGQRPSLSCSVFQLNKFSIQQSASTEHHLI